MNKTPDSSNHGPGDKEKSLKLKFSEANVFFAIFTFHPPEHPYHHRLTDLAGVDSEVGHELCLAKHVLCGAGVATLVILSHSQDSELVLVRHLQYKRLVSLFMKTKGVSYYLQNDALKMFGFL